MARLLNKWIMEPNTEIVVMSMIGICYTMMEDSFPSMRGRLQYLWTYNFPHDKFYLPSVLVIKTLLSLVMLARKMTTPVYIASYYGVIIVAYHKKKPFLLTPWIWLSLVKNLIANPISLVVGTFVCLPYRFPLACLEFFCIKSLEIALSVYMWKSVLELQHELALEEDTAPFPTGGPDDHERAELLDLRRRRGRSLVDEVENRHRYLDVSHISRSWTDDDELAFGPQPKMTEVTRTRSLDSLIVRLHSDWDMIDSLIGRRRDQEFGGPYYNLKEKAMRFLRLTTSDVERARRRIRERTPPRVRKRPSGTKVPLPSTLIVTTRNTSDFAAQVSTVSKKWLDRQVESVTVGQERSLTLR